MHTPKTYGPYQDRKGETIFAKILTPPYAFTEEAKSFEEVFKQVNAGYSAEELGVEDIEIMYQRAFRDEIKDFGKDGVINIRLETTDHNFVGYFSFEDLNIIAPEKYLPSSIYWRYLYVAPAFQQRGIGTLILTKLRVLLMPEAEHIYLVTRRTNAKAIKFYQHYNFKEGIETFHGWDPEKFISLEWHKPPVDVSI